MNDVNLLLDKDIHHELQDDYNQESERADLESALCHEKNLNTGQLYGSAEFSSKEKIEGEQQNPNAYKITFTKEERTGVFELFNSNLKQLGCRYNRSLKGYTCSIFAKQSIDSFLISKNIRAHFESTFDDYYVKSSKQKLAADESSKIEKDEDQLQANLATWLNQKAKLEREIEVRDLDESNPDIVHLRKELSLAITQIKELQASIDRRKNMVRLLNENEKVSSDKLPDGFFIEDNHLFFRPSPQKPEDNPAPIRICTKLAVTALTRDENQHNHGALLEFLDPDEYHHEWAMPMELLAGSGEQYRSHLLSRGLRIDSGGKPRSLLTAYIQGCTPKARVRCVLKTGWYGSSFIFPDHMIGSSGDEKVRFQSTAPCSIDFSVKGTLDEWKRTVSSLCKGNSRLIFSVSTAFAPPLLEPLETESGGFHLEGPSSIGKTTALRCARSVWGGKFFLKPWKSTANGIEGLCSSRNHTLLILDELSQFDPEKAGQAVYLIANESGASRLTSSLHLQKQASWQLLFLSSGEISLAAHVAEAGKKAKGGQEVRMVDIPADTGIHGLFENLHGRSDAATFSTELKETTLLAYGTPSRVFIANLCSKKTILIPEIKNRIKSFINSITAQKAMSSQVRRVLERFALVGIAGELATEFGITDWEKCEAEEAAKTCFYAWLKNRGSNENQEEAVALQQVRTFFALHGESRFTPFDAPSSSRTINRAGFRRLKDEEEFYVFPDIFRTEICKGLNSTTAVKICVKYGLLRASSTGETTHPVWLPETKKHKRFYIFTSKVFGEE